MTKNEVILYIVIPLISALIGGGLTLIGVLITTHHENKIRTEEKISNNEPLFYIFDHMQKFNEKETQEYIFYPEEGNVTGSRSFLLKNTDKSYIILESIKINGDNYYPKRGKVVNKDEIFYINVWSSRDFLNSENNEIILTVSDILNNKHKYRISYSSEKGKFEPGIPEKI